MHMLGKKNWRREKKKQTSGVRFAALGPEGKEAGERQPFQPHQRRRSGPRDKMWSSRRETQPGGMKEVTGTGCGER